MYDFGDYLITSYGGNKFTPNVLDKGDIVIEDCPEWQDAKEKGGDALDEYIKQEEQIVVQKDDEHIKIRHIHISCVIDDVEVRLDSNRVFILLEHALSLV